jgi:hypothetical protein
MDTRKFSISAIVASLLVLAGCATSPEEEHRRQEMEADIDDILSQELDPLEYGEVRTCLSDNQISRYRPLGNRHLLFEGKQGQLWVNMLRGRCPGLDKHSVIIMKPKLGGRLCDMDNFGAVDSVGVGLSTAPNCSLGQFKPITEAQLKEVQNRLEMR